MKAAIFALLFVTLQVCFSQDHSPEHYQAFDNCIQSLNLKLDEFIELNKQVEIPEEEDIIKFYECYANELGGVDDQGNLKSSIILERIETKLKMRMKNVPDGEAKAHHIAILAVEHCKDSPREGSIGLAALKQRNCLYAFVSNPELLNL